MLSGAETNSSECPAFDRFWSPSRQELVQLFYVLELGCKEEDAMPAAQPPTVSLPRRSLAIFSPPASLPHPFLPTTRQTSHPPHHPPACHTPFYLLLATCPFPAKTGLVRLHSHKVQQVMEGLQETQKKTSIFNQDWDKICAYKTFKVASTNLRVPELQ